MGMDVLGKNPRSKTGEYFRNNVWWWHPLWTYCEIVAPTICANVEHAHSNDGDGLDDKASQELASILELEIATGNTQRYAKQYSARLEALPLEPCRTCDGTRRHPHADDFERANPGWIKENNGCQTCHGEGVEASMETWYPFEVENVREFVAFLKDCGGFEIC